MVRAMLRRIYLFSLPCWRRKWQPTPVFLPGKYYGQRSLVGYSTRGCKRVRHNLVTKQQQSIPCRTIKILYIDHEVIENHNSPITEKIEKIKLICKKGHRSWWIYKDIFQITEKYCNYSKVYVKINGKYLVTQ